MRASCRLYHGPGAFEAAQQAASKLGRLLHEPFGEAGFKVDAAREFVLLMQSPPVGEDCGVLIAGPMDLAAPKSSDVLLKSIEEPPPYVIPLLWATDIGGVSPTIQSRCLPYWSPQIGNPQGDEEVEGLARELLQEVLNGNLWQVPILVGKVKGTSKVPSREHLLVQEVVEAMTARLDEPRVLALWERLRSHILVYRNPTTIEIISAFMVPKQ